MLRGLGRVLERDGRLDEALVAYRRAVGILTDAIGVDDPRIASPLIELASVQMALERPQAAYPHLAQAYALRRADAGEMAAQTLAIESVLADAALAAAQFRTAAEIFQRRLDRARAAKDEDALLPDLVGLAAARDALGELATAETLHREALELRETRFGDASREAALSLNALAKVILRRGRYDEAFALLLRDLEISKATVGDAHPETAATLLDLGALRERMGLLDEAEGFYDEALRIYRTTTGAGSRETARALTRQGELARQRGAYGAARAQLEEALAIRRDRLEPDDPEIGDSLLSIGNLEKISGAFDASEAAYDAAIENWLKAYGDENPQTAFAIGNRAILHYDLGRYAEAERDYRAALAIRETSLGPDHPLVAATLNNMANLFRGQGRYDQAEAFLKRALDSMRGDALAIGSEHPWYATASISLGRLLLIQGRLDEAQPVLARAVDLTRAAFGDAHYLYASALAAHGDVRAQRGDPDGVDDLQTALAITLAALGAGHPEAFKTRISLGRALRLAGDFEASERTLRLALGEVEALEQTAHPALGEAAFELGETLFADGRITASLSAYRRATAVAVARLSASRGENSDAARSEQRAARNRFQRHLNALIADGPDDDALEEAFRVIQLARATVTGTSVAQMAARFAVGDDALAAAVRTRQDRLERWRAIDAALLTASARPTEDREPALEAELAAERAELATAIREADRVLASDFPEYKSLSDPAPMTLAQVRAQLGPHEALVAISLGDRQAFVFALTNDAATAAATPVPRREVAAAVAALRKGLDPYLLSDGGSLFDFRPDLAHRLYAEIFQPVAALLDTRRSWLAVPDGELNSLPLGLLLTEPFDGPVQSFEDYRTMRWLIRAHAITVLPSIASLESLRRFAGASAAPHGFLGVGDPILRDHPSRAGDRLRAAGDIGLPGAAPIVDLTHLATEDAAPGPADDIIDLTHLATEAPETGPPDDIVDLTGFAVDATASEQTRGDIPDLTHLAIADGIEGGQTRGGDGAPPEIAALANRRAALPLSTLFRGGFADVRAIAALTSLPETADELELLGAAIEGETRLALREEATETAIKTRLPLDQYRILGFATHGLLAGELEGTIEPSLTWSPPVEANALDDGLLTASEIAQLKLDADWVLLSACNTAGPGGEPGDEGMTGLARAFFYAGARSLFVSHWPVVSDTTLSLTTRMLDEITAGADRAEAHRLSMTAMIDDADEARFAHPLFWAPFVIVGESS